MIGVAWILVAVGIALAGAGALCWMNDLRIFAWILWFATVDTIGSGIVIAWRARQPSKADAPKQ